MTETLLPLTGNVCLSGGAVGADMQWGMTAGRAGHLVVHFSFDGHRTDVPASERVVLSEESLKEADPHLIRANRTVGRSVPFGKPWIVNPLRRNYYQVRDAQAVYAVSHFTRGAVDGGTAWAVQMFVDRFPPGTPAPCYVYDQRTEVWSAWTGEGFDRLDGDPPVPTGVWAGIGSCTLLETGKRAIRRLMGYTGEPAPTGVTQTAS